MRNFTRLACCGAALALALGVTADVRAGKPGNDQPKTQACTLTGEAEGTGRVGIDAKSYGDLSMTVQSGSLAAVFNQELGVGTFSGKGRVLKTQGRLDFHFDLSETGCRPPAYGEEPGSLPDGVCRYHLMLLNGVYNRKKDDVVFQAPGTEAQLFDYDYRVGSGLVLIGEGSANLMLLF